MTSRGHFAWHELMTTDLAAAQAFYATVAGWSLADSGMPGLSYTIASVGSAMAAGLMALPDEVLAHGGRPGWIGYIAVADVDIAAGEVAEAGGTIHRNPADIPGVGRFAVAADPQGAVFALFKGEGPAPEPTAPFTPGIFGWHELHARDWTSAFTFYERLFGWEKSQAVDMGPMGTYQLVRVPGGPDLGGMMTNTQVPAPFWLYYIMVGDIDAGLARVTESGGQVIAGPHPVPGGSWIIHAFDPQGAMFALVGQRAEGAAE